VDLQVNTNVSEENTASFFRAEHLAFLQAYLLPQYLYWCSYISFPYVRIFYITHDLGLNGGNAQKSSWYKGLSVAVVYTLRLRAEKPLVTGVRSHLHASRVRLLITAKKRRNWTQSEYLMKGHFLKALSTQKREKSNADI
jgi:hypothetical protein